MITALGMLSEFSQNSKRKARHGQYKLGMLVVAHSFVSLASQTTWLLKGIPHLITNCKAFSVLPKAAQVVRAKQEKGGR